MKEEVKEDTGLVRHDRNWACEKAIARKGSLDLGSPQVVRRFLQAQLHLLCCFSFRERGTRKGL